MYRLTDKVKKELLKVLLEQNDLFGKLSEEEIINEINSIFDLYSLPSEDSRYDNAYEDAYQHFVANDDWDIEFLLQKRFKLNENDEYFISFLNLIISPNLRRNGDDIMKYYLIITPYIEKDELTFILTDHSDENLSIYKIGKKGNNDYPKDIIPNKIKFYVFHKSEKKTNVSHYDLRPKNFPSFGLYNNNGWNDYGNRSGYDLIYFKTVEDYIDIGRTKIIKKQCDSTPEFIEESFEILSDEYCSLGTNENYYKNIKREFENDFLSILWALKDAAFFTDIQENFENEYYFKNSLIRFDLQEQLLRNIKYIIYDYDLKNLYSFKYNFKPKYSENSIDIEFHFDNNTIISNRIYALIGKNGTGKTQLTSTLPLDISNKKNENFIPKTPLFSKVIAVSYSVFDNFEIPKKDSNFNYIYCGLKESNGELYSEKGLKNRFHNSWKKIKSKNRFDKWIRLLPLFLDDDLVEELIIEDNNDSDSFTVNVKSFSSISKKLSSGQSIFLYIITEIVANIRYDSLIIYDEPETHLHPNAISQLMNVIYQLTNQFNSFCIIATHSPLIVRELLSKNVYILEKEHDILVVRRPLIETFGENLTIITEEIFGNRDIPKQFKSILEKLVNKGYSYEEIINLLKSDNIPLSLNANMLLKSIMNEKS
ncbi:AAA family ATPase [Chishuiella sp.]|uniref:AbiJ-related protein n=1 Tax=Chishuiella sp. TaxID=1969467 RepID=UPI0028AFA1C1|nr:AAA family ATPase [Chishuiella sp.]